jgi:hypothetical protein
VYRSQQVHPKFVEHVASLVNPFAAAASGSKIHDENASKTFTFQSKQIIDIPINMHGVGYTEVSPTIKEYIRRIDGGDGSISGSGTIMGGTVAQEKFDVTDYDDLVAGAVRYRVVSWGVRLTAPYLNHDETKGTILIKELSETRILSSTSVTDLPDNYVNLPITKELDVTVIPNHIGESYKDFIGTGSTFQSLDSTTLGWNGIGLLIMGAPTGPSSTNRPCVQAEVVYNLEILPKITSITMRMATDPAPHDYGIMQSVHNTRAALPLAHKSTSLWSKVKSFATSALKSLGHYALDRVSGGLLSYVEGRPELKRVTNAAGQLLLTNG